MKILRPVNTWVWQALICAVVLSIWQWGYDLHASVPWLVPDLLDPYFVSKPSEIFQNFLVLSCIKSKTGAFNGWFNGEFAKCMARNENNLWVATAVTLRPKIDYPFRSARFPGQHPVEPRPAFGRNLCFKSAPDLKL